MARRITSYVAAAVLYFLLAPKIQAITTSDETESTLSKDRPLRGRFLQITDIHPDPFYQVHSKTDENGACHRGKGPAGAYGAETSDCDSPWSLVEATFSWIDKHLKDEIDFIVWTGDSARHDNDEKIPRDRKQVLSQNKDVIDQLRKVFGAERGFTLPIIPTFGNNDVLPHNIFSKAPNKWTKHYAELWNDFIPEEQVHQFNRGGWFYVEAIPNRLAVFSLNTMYFFTSNAAVDGCSASSEPGYQHFEWLRVQLQFLRQRGMKAILIGHVAPARNDAKSSWDETCWQKYALWLRQYRDVVVGSLYGHMNIDHFILQDFEDIKYKVAGGEESSMRTMPRHSPEFSVEATSDYLMELRKDWSKLPEQPKKGSSGVSKPTRDGKRKKSDSQKFIDAIGGEFAERFAVAHVAPSVVPNYFPTIRVFSYNTTGLENVKVHSGKAKGHDHQECQSIVENEDEYNDDEDFGDDTAMSTVATALASGLQTILGFDTLPVVSHTLETLTKKKRKHKKKKGQKKKKPKFTVPKGPSRSSLPGPAYSPQPLSITSIRQYYANLTYINNDFDFSIPSDLFSSRDSFEADRWQPGKHHGRKDGPKSSKPRPRDFSFEVEYETSNPMDVYRMSAIDTQDKREDKDDDPGHGFTVRSWVELAGRIGKFKPGKGDEMPPNGLEESPESEPGRPSDQAEVDKNKKKKKRRRRIINRSWFTFVDRATVSTKDADELHREFGQDYD